MLSCCWLVLRREHKVGVPGSDDPSGLVGWDGEYAWKGKLLPGDLLYLPREQLCTHAHTSTITCSTALLVDSHSFSVSFL